MFTTPAKGEGDVGEGRVKTLIAIVGAKYDYLKINWGHRVQISLVSLREGE